jgi:AraC family transcriptional regulator
MAPHAVIERIEIATGRREKLRPGAVQRSSGDLWRGIRLERRREVPGEVSEGYLLSDVIALHLSPPIPRDLYWPGQGWKPQRIATWSMQVFPARVPFAVRWAGCAELMLVEVPPEFVTAVAGRPHERLELRPFVVAEDPFINQTMLALEDDMRAGSPAGRLYGESLGIALASHLVRKYTDVTKESQERTALSSAMLSLVLQYIADNLETDLSLQDLADLVQTDVYRFVRLFKQCTGRPPHQYILHERIERAKSLLCNPVLPLTEVALRSGFADQSHFTNAFHRMTSISPLAYRRAIGVTCAPRLQRL